MKSVVSLLGRGSVVSYCVAYCDDTMSLVQGQSGPYAGFYVNLLVLYEHKHKMLEHSSSEHDGQDA